MTIPVYSQRFLSGHNLTSYIAFQCPTGYTCVCTSFDGYAGAPGTSAQLNLTYQPVSGNAIVIAALIPPVSAQPFSGHWSGRWVFFPGEYLLINPFGGPWDGAACGYQLTGEPPEIIVPTESGGTGGRSTAEVHVAPLAGLHGRALTAR